MIKHRQYNLHKVGDHDMPESIQKVKFKRGQSGTMPSDLEAGSLLVQVDTGDIFLDNTESDRIQLGDSRKLPLSGGTMAGPINMGSQKITNLGTPSDSGDAVTKLYVDTELQALDSEMGTTLAGYLQLKGGTMTGVMDMGGHYIQNLKDPQSDNQAATKGYVDGQVEGLQSTINSSLNNYLPLSGGTLTGALTLNGNPSQDNQAANKAYVDSQISGLSSVYLPLSGGTLTGPLVLSGNPTQSNQAANKQYVDDTLTAAVGGITGFEIDSNNGSGYANYEALTSAHPTGELGTFYLVVNPDSSAPNAFDEYFWTGTAYEKAGAFGDVDTSGLATKQDLAGYLPLTGGTLTLGDYEMVFGAVPSGSSIESGSYIHSNGMYMQFRNNRTIWFSALLDSAPVTLSNVRDPVDYNDAATKGYVDNSVSTAVGGNYLPISGGTLTGPLTLNADPTADLHAATKQYVDTKVDAAHTDVQALTETVAYQFVTKTPAPNNIKIIPVSRTKPMKDQLFFVLFGAGVTTSSGTFTLRFTVRNEGVTDVVVSGGGTIDGETFPPMPTISMPAWTMGTFYMYSDNEAKFIAYTNYIDDGVVS